jgi:hypothetical protein
MLRSLSAPNILCAFDNPLGTAAGDLAAILSFSFVAACLRPGTGNENLEVRPIVSDNSKPQRMASKGTLDVVLSRIQKYDLSSQDSLALLSLKHCAEATINR